MSEKKVVIFDLDGTLLDTLQDLGDSLNRMLEHFGYPTHSYESVKEMVGNGATVLTLRAIPGGENNPNCDECIAYFRANYNDKTNKKTKPYDGIIDILDRLKERGVYTAVVTNKPHHAATAICDGFFGDKLDMVIGDREGVRRKPYPDSVFEVMEQLGVDRAVYVGDADTDIETAKNAGIPSVSVTWGFRDRDFLIEHGAEALVDDAGGLLCELERLLGEELGEPMLPNIRCGATVWLCLACFLCFPALCGVHKRKPIMRPINLHPKCADITGYMSHLTVICDYQKTRRYSQ